MLRATVPTSSSTPALKHKVALLFFNSLTSFCASFLILYDRKSSQWKDIITKKKLEKKKLEAEQRAKEEAGLCPQK